MIDILLNSLLGVLGFCLGGGIYLLIKWSYELWKECRKQYILKRTNEIWSEALRIKKFLYKTKGKQRIENEKILDDLFLELVKLNKKDHWNVRSNYSWFEMSDVLSYKKLTNAPLFVEVRDEI